MINVKYNGTFGNNMWQYAVARIIAEERNLQLNVPPIEGLPNTYEHVNGRNDYNSSILLTGHTIDFNSLDNKSIFMDGYFQRYEYIKGHKEKIKKWFQTSIDPIEVNSNDLVLTIRRGWNGYPVHLCPPASFYLDVLDHIDYDKIILCTDTFEDPYFNFLDSLDVPVIKAQYSGLDQYVLIKSANKILISPSTFSWWASYLSDATEIYYPMISDLIPTENGVNWLVDDEDRYVFINYE
jgi:hypothetical protein